MFFDEDDNGDGDDGLVEDDADGVADGDNGDDKDDDHVHVYLEVWSWSFIGLELSHENQYLSEILLQLKTHGLKYIGVGKRVRKKPR